jgi:hypothetical protein
MCRVSWFEWRHILEVACNTRLEHNVWVAGARQFLIVVITSPAMKEFRMWGFQTTLRWVLKRIV